VIKKGDTVHVVRRPRVESPYAMGLYCYVNNGKEYKVIDVHIKYGALLST
jgi:hypothetical protein